MTLYRGPGGTGSATSDADTTLYQDFLNQTIAARDAALQAEINAELAETNAETAETNAETAETNAETAATTAASSASAAASSASSASTSASNASTSASAASTSATAAASSASSAASSASAASTSASNAATSETNAASSASSASTSATNAANSASTATTQATNAASSATAAASSASSASTSATNAANSASAASTSATNAATSATAAAASASEAAGYAASIDPATLVRTTGTQTIGGDKTFSSNPTLSAGTANGVLFLNAGKAISSGTAFSFDGSSVTVKTSSGGYLNLDSTATGTSNTIASLLNNSAAYAPLNYNATAHVYQISSSEGMRLTSTGLGIGTSSPGVKLDVAAASGVVRVTSTTGTNGVYYQASNTGGGLYMGRDDSDGGSFYTGSPAYGAIFLSTGAYPMAFAIDSVERMRLDSSGNLSLNSASVNGVAYFNGSKVLTTGGNLTFDGTNFGVGTASPQNDSSYGGLTINGGNGSILTFRAGGVNSGRIYTTATDNLNIDSNGSASGNIIFRLGTGSTEQMRLTSTGLGIGTSSPQAKLSVNPYTQYDNTVGTSERIAVFAPVASGAGSAAQVIIGNGLYGTSGTENLRLSFANSQGNDGMTSGWSILSNVGTAPDVNDGYFSVEQVYRGVSVHTRTERMRLDSSGNLGLGVTPSAWTTATVTPLQVKNASFSGTSAQAFVGNNWYYGGGDKYISSAAAALFQLNGSTFSWLQAPSGTAGNAISFTQAMTLTAGGNQLIGTTTDSGERLVVVGTANTDQIRFSDATNATGWLANRTGGLTTLHTNGILAFGTGNGTFTERARIDSSGNFGIGTSSPFNKLTVVEPSTSSGVVFIGNQVNTSNAEYGRIRFGSTAQSGTYINYGGQIASFTAGGIDTSDLRFYTAAGAASTERARIDSSGNLLVGTTSGYSSRVGISWDSSVQSGIILRTSSATLSGNPIIFQDSGGTARGSISQTASAVAYNTSSDYRLKHDIQPMTGALAKVAALKPCTYKWNVDGSDGQGFIAHELAEVVPDAVTGEKDAVDAEGNPVYQGIDTSFLVATLTAAIQELKAEFDAYKATHP